MSTVLMSNQEELMEALYQRLIGHFPENHHANLNVFIRELFKHASMRDLSHYELTDLAGMVVTLWRSIQTKSKRKASINVINPNVEEHEWQSQHTIVSILQDEIPFVIDSARLALNKRNINIHAIFYGTFGVQRNKKGEFQGFSDAGAKELLLCIEMLFLMKMNCRI